MRASSFRVDSRSWGRVLAAALALTLATAALAGCGSEDKPKADPSPTSKPSVPPGLDTTPPSKPADQTETKQSAVEYGRYFALLVQHAIRTRDIRPVMAETRDQAKCSTCRDLSEHIEQNLRAEKLWEDTPDLRLGKFSARQSDAGFEVTGPFEYPPGKVVTIDGTKRDVAPGGPFKFALYMVWDAEGSRWRVIDYTFLSKSQS
jgi:hypothetical protein